MTVGRLIVFEGLDGCGKTTQLARLAVSLREAGRDVLETREPTDGPWGRRIREAARIGEARPHDELHWFVEDRREHVRDVVTPALAAGRTLLCDRYYLSTVAYQGAAGLDWRQILANSESEFPRPDLVLLLELAPETGLSRVGSRGGAREDLFEHAERQARVAEIFAALDLPYLERIDASGDEQAVAARVRAAVEHRLSL